MTPYARGASLAIHHLKLAFSDLPEKKEKDEGLSRGTRAAIGVGGVAGGLVAGSYAQPLLTGRTRLYHGTTEGIANKIYNEGLRPSAAVNGPAITDLLSDDIKAKAKNLAYMTPNRSDAGMYAGQAEFLRDGGSINDVAGRGSASAKGMMNPFHPGIASADVPLWRADIASKLRDNPEARGSFDEFMKHQGPFARLNEDALRDVHESFTEAKSFDGGLDAKWFHNSPNYQGIGLSEIGEYARTKPWHFAGGVGLGLAGAGALAYGGHQLYKAIRGPEKPAKPVNQNKVAGLHPFLVEQLPHLGHAEIGATLENTIRRCRAARKPSD